jgi:hypothetical protein
VRLSPNHQVAGNPMRFRTGRVDIRADEAWRTGFGAARRRLVTALTLPLLARYGYLGTGSASAAHAEGGETGRDRPAGHERQA